MLPRKLNPTRIEKAASKMAMLTAILGLIRDNIPAIMKLEVMHFPGNTYYSGGSR
jgi:hypothetical protein